MKRASLCRAGFTIVEAMIFLVVTGVLLTSALLLFNGRIARTQFSQAVQELDTRIKSTINEVGAGNYPTSPAFTCSAASGVPVVTATPSEQGTNTSCMFLGKVVQAGVAGQNGCGSGASLQNCTNLNIYTVVGRRSLPSGQIVTNLVDAQPRLVDGIGAGSAVNLTVSERLKNGLQVTRVRNLSTGGDIGAIGILQTLGSYTGARLNPGTQSLQTWPIASGFPRTQQEIDNAVNSAATTFAASQADPARGIIICLQGSPSNQRASITIGLNDGRLTTNSVIGDNSACV